MAVTRFSFSLDAVKDSSLIRWIELQPTISHTVREALLAYKTRPTHQDLDAKLDEILQTLSRVQVISGAPVQAEGGASEPARAVKGLDAMVNRFRSES